MPSYVLYVFCSLLLNELLCGWNLSHSFTACIESASPITSYCTNIYAATKHSCSVAAKTKQKWLPPHLNSTLAVLSEAQLYHEFHHDSTIKKHSPRAAPFLICLQLRAHKKKKKNAVKIYNSNIEFQLGRQCIAKAKYKAAKHNRWKYGLKYKSKEKEPFTPHEKKKKWKK